jgi:hypothetical protein
VVVEEGVEGGHQQMAERVVPQGVEGRVSEGCPLGLLE